MTDEECIQKVRTDAEECIMAPEDKAAYLRVADLAERLGEALLNRAAAFIAHRACCGSEHDPSNGKLHGYCVICGVPWPCDVAKAALASKDKP